MTRPLSALLSQTLIAFTIEFDNEAVSVQFLAASVQDLMTADRGGATDRQRGSTSRRPWLVSLPMWSNYLRFVGEQGTSVRELQMLSGVSEATLRSPPGALWRWGYIVVGPDATDKRPSPPQRDWLVRSPAAGRRAHTVWRPLAGVIETRRQTRFGREEIGRLRQSLEAIVNQFDGELPQAMPVLG